MALRVGVVGPGNVGTTLGRRLARARHAVRYGSRDPGARPELGSAVGPVADVSSWAEVIVLALPGFCTPAAARALARSLGPGAEGGPARSGARAGRGRRSGARAELWGRAAARRSCARRGAGHSRSRAHPSPPPHTPQARS
jgi:hypothetical protein